MEPPRGLKALIQSPQPLFRAAWTVPIAQHPTLGDRESEEGKILEPYLRRAPRERLAQAELAMDNLLHSDTYDHQRCEQLLQDINSARNELLALLSSLWPESAEAHELPISDGEVRVNTVPEIPVHHL